MVQIPRFWGEVAVEHTKKYTIGLLKSFPVILVAGFISIGIIFRIVIFIYFGVATLVVGLFNEYILKPIFKNYVCGVTGARPIGARGCDVFSCDRSSDDSFGMPSGHALVAIFFATFWSLYLGHHNGWRLEHNLSGFIYLWIISLLVVVSRVWFGCHTVQQVIIGGIIGATLALWCFRLAY